MVDIKFVEDQIEFLNTFHGKQGSTESFDQLYKVFYAIGGKIPLLGLPFTDQHILRGRPNYDAMPFKEQWEISYNERHKEKIKLGRFNKPQAPMFYGSLTDGIAREHPLLASSLECCKELIDEENQTEIQYITFGQWHAGSQMLLLNLCNDNECMDSNPIIRNLIENSVTHLVSLVGENASIPIIKFWKFVSQKAAYKFENDCDHLITSAYLYAFIDYYREKKKVNISGAIYPSTITENKGLNIVLVPQAVDKNLALQYAFMTKVTRTLNPKHLDIDSSKLVDVIDGKFELQFF